MSYATERDAAVRTPQAILSLGLPRCENFYATPVKQLLQYTEDFSNAVWTKSGMTVFADDPISNAPNATTTADRVQAAANNDYVEQVATGYAAASATFVFSCFLATRGSASIIRLQIRDSTGSEIGSVDYQLTTSWTRVSMAFQFSGAATGDVRVRIINTNDPGASANLFWGANLTKNPVNNNALALFPYVKRVAEADTVIATMASRCQAADNGDGARCTFNLISGCQDPTNYNAGNSWVYPVFELFPFDSNGDPKNGIREFKFCVQGSPLPFKGGAAIRPMLQSWDQAPQEIDASRVAIGKESDGGFITRNEEASYRLRDDNDPGVWDQDKANLGGLINTARGGGSFWRRLLAIHPNFDNPRGFARLYTGYLFSGSTEADYQLRLSGPIRRIRVNNAGDATIEATDILIVTSRKIPSQISTTNYLSEGIDASTTSINVIDPTEISDPAPNADEPETFNSDGMRNHGPDWIVTLVIDSEKMNVISKTAGGNPLTVTRGRWGTAAASHFANTGFTEVREYGTEQTTPGNPVLGANPIDIKMSLFRESGIGWALSTSPHEGIDIIDHFQQRNIWVRSFVDPTFGIEGGVLFRQTVTEPTSIDDLLRSVDRDVVSFQFVDDNRHVRTRVFAPPTPNDTLIELTDVSHFVEGSVSVETDMESRLSRVIVGWDLTPGLTGDVLGDYEKQAISVDPVSEAAGAHNSIKDIVLLSRWMRGADTHRGAATAARIRSRFARGARFLTGTLEAKDDDNVTLGTFCYVTTAQIQTATGATDGKKIMLAISKRRGTDGRMTIEFIDAGFSGRLWFWQDAAGAPADYDSATDAQRRFAFWADANGKVDASLADPYLWS